MKAKIALVLSLLCACSPKLVVPPAHIAHGDSPRTVRAGKGAVAMGVGGYVNMDIFRGGYGGRLWSVDGTFGVRRDLDLRFIGTWNHLYLEEGDPWPGIAPGFLEQGLHPDIQSAFLRLKWNPGPFRDFWAATLGGGVGRAQEQ